PPATDAARLRTPRTAQRARARRRRRAASRERLLNRVVEVPGLGDTPDAVLPDLAAAVDEERLGQAGEPPRLPELRRPVVRDRIGQLVLLHEALRVAGEVARVDADEDDAILVLPPRVLEQRRLRAARPAPGRPKVDHHRLADVVGDG